MSKYNGYIKFYLGPDYDNNAYVLCLLTSIRLKDVENPENGIEKNLTEFVFHKNIKDWNFLFKELKTFGYYYDPNSIKSFNAADLYLPRRDFNNKYNKQNVNKYIPPQNREEFERTDSIFFNPNNYDDYKKLDKISDEKMIQKFVKNKPSLFLSHPKETVLTDEESLFSVTPETLAKHIASRMNYKTILDAFCGPGGNLIQFVLNGSKVLAVDNDPNKLCQARHNLDVYLKQPPQERGTVLLDEKRTRRKDPHHDSSDLSNGMLSSPPYPPSKNNITQISKKASPSSNNSCYGSNSKGAVVFLCDDFENVIEYFRQNSFAPPAVVAASAGNSRSGSRRTSETSSNSSTSRRWCTPFTSRRSSPLVPPSAGSGGGGGGKYAQTVFAMSGLSVSPKTPPNPPPPSTGGGDRRIQTGPGGPPTWYRDHLSPLSYSNSVRTPSPDNERQLDLSFLGKFSHLHYKGLDNVDAIFLDPPWGGLNYERKNAFDLDVLDFNLGAIYKKSCNVTPNIVFKFPKNSNICQIASLLKPGSVVEIEQNYLNGWLKFLILYFENCINQEFRERMERDIRLNEENFRRTS